MRTRTIDLRELEEGHLSILRQERYAGRDALVLADDEPGMNRQIWVAADSHLPLRMTASWAPGESYEIICTWIPASEAGSATFWPEPPAGSRQVPAPATGDGTKP
jgi:hypothetical protein